MLTLRKNLSNLLEQKNISIASLERKTGLNRSSINNVLTGASRHPSVKTLQIIAKALDISVESMMENNDANFEILNEIQLKAFLQSSSVAVHKLIEKDSKITIDQLIDIVREIYSYSIRQSPASIDNNFVDWLIDKKVKF